MEETNSRIRSACARFACSQCRTKTGWPHQSWCSLRGSTEGDCPACRYFDRRRKSCAHPAGKAVMRK